MFNAHRMALGGLLCLMVSVVGAVLLILEVVLGQPEAAWYAAARRRLLRHALAGDPGGQPDPGQPKPTEPPGQGVRTVVLSVAAAISPGRVRTG